MGAVAAPVPGLGGSAVPGPMGVGSPVESIGRVQEWLAALDTADLPDQERLDTIHGLLRLASQARAVAMVAAAAAEADHVAVRANGASLVTWLGTIGAWTRPQLTSVVYMGKALQEAPSVARAATSGQLVVEQGLAIAGVLDRVAEDLDPARHAEAAEAMIGFADRLDSAGLTRVGDQLLEMIDPDGHDAREAHRLERQVRLATAARHLTFSSDRHGSVLIRGSLPELAAEPLRKVIDSYALQSRRTGLDALDPHTAPPTMSQYRADALCRLATVVQQSGDAPRTNGDLPRIVYTIDHDQLRDACHRTGLMVTDRTRPGEAGQPTRPAGHDQEQPSDEPIPPGRLRLRLATANQHHARLLPSGPKLTPAQLRQLACDADLVPVVLNSDSIPLDIGRETRLVTPTVRLALTLRDQGCTFPGCHQSPNYCHAHHIDPWWAGGPTILSNLTLLCPHHHTLIEPNPDGPPGARWELRLDAEGIPYVLPPTRLDPNRTRLYHQRFHHLE